MVSVSARVQNDGIYLHVHPDLEWESLIHNSSHIEIFDALDICYGYNDDHLGVNGNALIENISINSFIHSGYFYSTSSNPQLLRCAPDYRIDTVSELTCLLSASYLRHFSLTVAGLIAPLSRFLEGALYKYPEWMNECAEVLQATMSDGLAQFPYVAAARVGFKPATFWTQGAEPTTEPHM